MRNRTAAIVAGVWLAWAGQAAAQPAAAGAARPAPPPRDPGRSGAVELSASVSWVAPSSLGSADANLTANDTRASRYRLFSASGDLQGAAGLEARLGYHLTRRYALEGGLTFSRPGVRISLANDVESAADLTATGETLSQFFLDASLLVYLAPGGGAARRLRPFVDAGAGYMRELHGQSGAMSGYFWKQTGQVYHVGGGAKYFFSTPRGRGVTGYGLRVDARYYIRRGGFSFDGSNAKSFSLGAGLVLAF